MKPYLYFKKQYHFKPRPTWLKKQWRDIKNLESQGYTYLEVQAIITTPKYITPDEDYKAEYHPDIAERMGL